MTAAAAHDHLCAFLGLTSSPPATGSRVNSTLSTTVPLTALREEVETHTVSFPFLIRSALLSEEPSNRLRLTSAAHFAVTSSKRKDRCVRMEICP